LDELARRAALREREPNRALRRGPACLVVFLAVTYAVALGGSGLASASIWTVHLSGGTGEGRAQTSPAAPTGVTATCTSPSTTTIKVSWSSVTHATNYSVYKSTTSSSSGYSLAATVTSPTTSWTSGSLSSGNYWFEVAVSIGTNWTSGKSSATSQRTIGSSSCT